MLNKDLEAVKYIAKEETNAIDKWATKMIAEKSVSEADKKISFNFMWTTLLILIVSAIAVGGVAYALFSPRVTSLVEPQIICLDVLFGLTIAFLIMSTFCFVACIYIECVSQKKINNLNSDINELLKKRDMYEVILKAKVEDENNGGNLNE